MARTIELTSLEAVLMTRVEREAVTERIGWVLDHFDMFLFALCVYPGADAVEQAKTSHRCAECI